MSRRTDYTEDDEGNLAMYIAKYNPAQKGRLGESLYRTLCDDIPEARKKWPFAKRHPWQSWREHYRKNQLRMDKRIDRNIKRFHKGAPPVDPPAPSSSGKNSSARVEFSKSDDDHLAEYIATHPARSSLKGERFWIELEEQEAHPWVSRHPWRSWRERYKKNEDYFNWAVRRHLAGDDFDEPDFPRPRTVEEKQRGRPSAAPARPSAGPSRAQSNQNTRKKAVNASPVKREPASQPVPAEKRKRPRVSEAEVERPAKKTRVEADQTVVREGEMAVDRGDDAGPSARSQTVVAHEEDVSDRDATDANRNAEQADVVAKETADADGVVVENDVQGVTEECVKSDEDDDSDADESDENEPAGPPGSDDYRNEIFDSSPVPSAAVNGEVAEEQDATSDGSEEDQEELDEIFAGDDDQAEDVVHEQEEMAVDHAQAAGPTLEGVGSLDDDEGEPAAVHPPQEQLATTGPSSADAASASAAVPMSSTTLRDPPARKPNTRVRETELPTVTPELSPSQEAAERHRGQKVPLRHAKRIKKSTGGDFFGTPPPNAADDGEPSSPTEEVEARHHALDAPRARQPPRLDEGAFNKAFSDPRGRARISPTGKARRRSGVDFSEEADADADADAVGTQDVAADDDEEVYDEEHVSELPQWPPVRRKSSGKPKARPPLPATPSPTGVPDGKRRERTVTTKVVSVRTVRTVERRVNRRPKGTPFPRRALMEDEDEDEVQEAESLPQRAVHEAPSPGQDDMEVDEDGQDSWLVQSQHHPFSQVPHPFSQAVEASPSRRPTVRSEAPLAKADISLFQRLLKPQTATAGPSEASNSTKPRVQPQPPKRAPLAEIDRARLEKMLRMEGKHAFPEPTKRSEPSPGSAASTSYSAESNMRIGVEDAPAEDDGEFGHHQSSPLADKGDQRTSTAHRSAELASAVASGSRLPAPRVDKGKGRADGPPSHAHSRRYTAHDVFYQPVQREDASTSKRYQRRSLPALFAGDDSHHYSALSLALGPPPFGYARTSSVPSTLALSRSVSPAKSANASLADTLPPSELEMVKELGMNTALHIMARNHGFNEETVRAVYHQTGSLRLADEVLRKMRESANDRASEALSELLSDDEDDEDRDEDIGERDAPGDEAEVERALTQPPEWPQDGPSFDLEDDAPLAESSRIDAAHGPRKRRRLVIEPVTDANSSVDSQYSPPKHTRAAQHLRRERESMGASRRGSAPAATVKVESPVAPRLSGGIGEGVALGELARLDAEGWRQLEERHGKGAGKVLAGKSLAKLLQR